MLFRDTYKLGLDHAEYADFKSMQYDYHKRQLKKAGRREFLANIVKNLKKCVTFLFRLRISK